MAPLERRRRLEGRVRLLLVGFVVGLVLSGVTAFPLPREVSLLAEWLGAGSSGQPVEVGSMLAWIVQVRDALLATGARYPFLAYGTDWLAFAHLVIALMFLGPIKDPVRNIWVIQWGMLACALVLPVALLCGPMRGIPFG